MPEGIGTETFWKQKFKSTVDSDSRSLDERLSDNYNVKGFRVKGDGVTDDYARFQTAVNSASGSLFVPAGTYLLSAPIVIPKGLILYGCRAETTKLKYIGGATSEPLIKFNNGFIAHSGVKNLSLDCGGEAAGVLFDQHNDSYLDECQVYSFKGYGLKFLNGVHCLSFRNRFRDASSATAVGVATDGGSGHAILRNSFGLGTATGIGIDFLSPSNGLFIGPGNAFEPCNIGIRAPALNGGSINALTITGCFFESCASSPIQIGGGGGSNDLQGVSIVGNEFASSGNGPISIDHVAFLTIQTNRFGPDVTYESNITRLHLMGNRYSGSKTINCSGFLDLDEHQIDSLAGEPGISVEGKLGVGVSAPLSTCEIAGHMRVTDNSNIPTTGSGLEVYFQTSPAIGIINCTTRPSTLLPLLIQASKYQLTSAAIPEFADNAAAVLGGLTQGEVYKTSAGALMIVL